MFKQLHEVRPPGRMTNVHLPSRNFRLVDFKQKQNTTASVTRGQQNGFLCIKVKARNGIQTFPKYIGTIQRRH